MTTRRKKSGGVEIVAEQARAIKTQYPKALGTNEYWTKYSCDNCGWSGSIKFEKGTIAPETAVCPTCICFQAKKSLPIRIPQVETVPVPLPLPKDPIVPTPAWPRPQPGWPYDPWQVPHRPYRPWDVPTQPHFDPIRPMASDNDAIDDRSLQGIELW